MIYRYGITTAANTTEAAAQMTIITLPRGIIHQLDIVFPPGPAGLLHLRILEGISVIWPSSQNESFAGDNTTISFKEFYILKDATNQIIIQTWNDDDTYSHLVIVRFGVLKRRFVLNRIF